MGKSILLLFFIKIQVQFPMRQIANVCCLSARVHVLASVNLLTGTGLERLKKRNCTLRKRILLTKQSKFLP